MFDIHQQIENDCGDRDEERYADYSDGLVEAFAESAEGRAHAAAAGEVGGWAHLFLDYYFGYIGGDFPDITVRDAQEICFDLFPRKVSTEPESAAEIMTELRAFWAFLGREFRLPQADAMQALLDDDAVLKLKNRLADPGNYGMAKSFVMMGRQAGFDMSSERGMQEFMLAYNASRLAALKNPEAQPALPHRPAYFDEEDTNSAPPRIVPRPLSSKEKRKKRKAQRQARKRNRR